MATAAVVYAITQGGGRAAWSYGSNGDESYTSGTPVRPLISRGLRDALKGQPSTTGAGRGIVYWSPYISSLRCCVTIGTSTGFELSPWDMYQPYEIQYTTSSPGEPSTINVAKSSSGEGLETFAKNVIQSILRPASRVMEAAGSMIESGYNGLGNFLLGPGEFVKASPAMPISKQFDDWARGDGYEPDGGSSSGQGTEVWTLPGETLNPQGPYSDNPVYGGSDSGAGGDSNVDNVETKNETLERLLKNLGNILQKFVNTDDDLQRGPGSPIWSKLLGILDMFKDMEGLISTLIDIPSVVPNTIETISEMFEFINDFLIPLLDAMGLSLTPKNKPVQTNSNIDFSALIQAIRGDSDQSLLSAFIDVDTPYLSQIVEYFETGEHGLILGSPEYVRLGNLGFDINDWV